MAYASTFLTPIRAVQPPWRGGLRRLLLLLAAVLLLGQFTARADSGLYKDFVVLQASGTTTYYRTYSGLSVPNLPFQGANLGTFSPGAAAPQSLLLNGAEANTYEGNGATMQAVRLFYRVYEQGTVPGAFAPLELAYRYSGIDGNPNNRKWDQTTAGLNLVQQAGHIGTFVLEVYFQADVAYAGGVFRNYDSNGGNNYRATFTVGQATQAFPAPGYAEVDNNFRTQVGQVFGALETNRVNTGLLLDYAFELANPRNFDGVRLEDSTLVSQGVYSDLYTTLYTSRFNSYSASMRHPSVHDSLCYTARQQGVITLSGLLFNYNAINPGARDNGTLETINNQFKDKYVNGVWQNPYQTLTTLAIAPSAATYSRSTCQVVMPASLFLSNLGSQVSSIYFDAADGNGYRPISLDVPVALHYDSVGLKHWQFRVTLASGQQLYSHSNVYFERTSDLASSGSHGTAARGYGASTDIDAFFPVVATESYLGRYGVADVVISYRNASDKVLRKPLIVAEGFDPGHIISPEAVEGVNTFKSFMYDVVYSSRSQSLQLLINGQYGTNSDYDIVYVNWRNGTDYLQRNALVLEEVIREVNRRKQPLNGVMQQNVVLGSSMGGVIARMALGRMERNAGASAHQTRLYVSLDAPHQGATAPLGYQAGARHAARMYIGTGPIGAAVEAIQFIRGGLSPLTTLLLADQPAARQMLINRITLTDQTDNSAHIAFQQELKNSWAYPASVRKVAISNGSECGIDQEFAPNSALLYHYRSVKTRFLSDLIGMAAGVGLVGLGVPPTLTLPLVLPGSSKFELTLDVRSLAANGGNRVYYGNVRYTKKILWLVPVTVNIVNHSYTAPSGLLPIDTYPGGFYYAAFDNQPGYASQDWAFTYDNSFYLQHRFTFVPTASALDIGQGNFTLGAADYLRRYVGANPPTGSIASPFANFTTAFNQDSRDFPFVNETRRVLNNELHESLYLRTANWLAAELNGNPAQTNCQGQCGTPPPAISGSPTVCGTNDFSISNLPQGYTVAWSLEGNAGQYFTLQANTPGANQARVSNRGNGIGNGTLVAVLTSNASPAVACADLTLRFNFSNATALPWYQESCSFYNVSHPVTTGTCGDGNAAFVHQGCRVYVDLGPTMRTVTLASGGTPTTWGTLTNSRYPNTLYFELPIGSGGVPFTFNVGGGGGCAGGQLLFFSISNNGRYAYDAWPNPTSDRVVVTATPNDPALAALAKAPTAAYRVEVYEVTSGRLVLTQENVSGDPRTQFDMSKMRAGYYILHISDGESSKTIKIYKE